MPVIPALQKIDRRARGNGTEADRLALSTKPGDEIFIDRLAMADGHEAYDPCLMIDGVDDSKAADAVLPQSVEFTVELLPTFGVGRDRTNCRFDGPL